MKGWLKGATRGTNCGGTAGSENKAGRRHFFILIYLRMNGKQAIGALFRSTQLTDLPASSAPTKSFDSCPSHTLAAASFTLFVVPYCSGHLPSRVALVYHCVFHGPLISNLFSRNFKHFGSLHRLTKSSSLADQDAIIDTSTHHSVKSQQSTLRALPDWLASRRRKRHTQHVVQLEGSARC